jgi:hypothetical protein
VSTPGHIPNQGDWRDSLLRARSKPTLREAVAELQHRYRFWRACCIGTWVLAAAVIVMESR